MVMAGTAQPPGAGREAIVYLLKNGTQVGTEKYTPQLQSTPGDLRSWQPSDLWGTTFTQADVNATGFGVAIVGLKTSGVSASFSLDDVQITVFTN